MNDSSPPPPSSFIPYPSYKDSGVQWLGKVPKHWCEVPFFSIAKEKVMQGNTNEELLSVYLNKGVIKYSQSTGKQVHKPSEDMSKYQLVEPTDFVLNNQQAWRGSVGISRYKGIVSPAYLVFSINRNSIIPTFGNYLFRDRIMIDQFVISSKGVGSIQRNLYLPFLKRTRVPIPPLSEQTTIARFLDYKTAQIARFIKAKKQMIELLKEQKQVIINDAVTGKIVIKDEGGRLKAEKRPDSSFIPHSSSFLQTVPEGWEVRRLKFVASMKSGDNITSETIDEQGDYPVYGGNGLRGYTSSFTHEGLHILIGRQGALCGNINYTTEGKFWASEHAVVVSPKIDIDLFWFGELLKAMNLNQYSIAAAQPGLSVDRILNLFIPFPDYNEQKRISESIKKQTASLDLAISRTEREIGLMQEYRTRLVSDVVTGKIDVRDIEIPDIADIDDTIDESIDEPEGEEESETAEAEE